MQYSGIIVTVLPVAMEETVKCLKTAPGLEIHHQDAARSRLVVVREGDDTSGPEEAFRFIQDLPGVITVELACHVVDSEGDDSPVTDSESRGHREEKAD